MDGMQYDLFADFHINRFCNFDCSYCYWQGPERHDPAHRGAERERIVSGFNGSGLAWFIHITGGEPFLHPEFVDVCRDLAQRHYISINTNLSTPNAIARFADVMPPDRVGYLHCSYHMEIRKGEADRKTFAERVKLLRAKGFSAHVSQLFLPGMSEAFPALFERFRKDGILLRPKVLKGVYGYKAYPAGYTQTERDMIRDYVERSRENIGDKDFFDAFFFREDEFVDCDLSFKGQPCRAGSGFVVVLPNGDVLTCLGMLKPMGNLFDGSFKRLSQPVLCAANKCTSIRFGLCFCDGTPQPVPDRPLLSFTEGVVNRIKRLFPR